MLKAPADWLKNMDGQYSDVIRSHDVTLALDWFLAVA